MSVEPGLRALAAALDAGLAPRALVDDPQLAQGLPPPVRAALRSPAPLGSALREAGALDEGPAALVDAGAHGGFLPRALRLAADVVQAGHARRRRALLALAYPALLVVTAGVVLPLPRLFTHGVDAWLEVAAPFVLAVLALFALVFVVGPRLPAAVRARLHDVAARVPFVGVVVQEDRRAASFEVLGALLAAGAPVTTSLRAAGLGDAERALARGETLAQALGPFVDEARAGRIAIAERSGALDAALPALAQDARERAARRFAALAVVLGLLCFGAVAAAIGAAIVQGARGYVDTIERAAQE